MTPDSFSFTPDRASETYNSFDDWGIRVVAWDFLLPPKRARKVRIPGRDGKYDYGAQNWDERNLRISCTLERKITKTALREIAYILSQKGKVRLWNEEDVYYVGEIYDAAQVTDYFDESGREFDLDFVCEPTSYGALREIAITDGMTPLTIRSTAETPVLITLKNTGSTAITRVNVTVSRRK